MPLSMMATSTATLGLMRTLGGTIGISIGDAIFSSELRRRLPKIRGFSASTGSGLTNTIRGLSQIQPISLRNEVQHAYSRSIAVIWLVSIPLSFVGFLVSLLIKNYTLQRNVIKEGKHGALVDPNAQPTPVGAPSDPEKVPATSCTD